MFQLTLLLMPIQQDSEMVCTSVNQHLCTGQELTQRSVLMLEQRLFLMDHTLSLMLYQDSMDHTQMLSCLHLARQWLVEMLMLTLHSMATSTSLMVTLAREVSETSTLLTVIMFQLTLLLMPIQQDSEMVCTSVNQHLCTGQELTQRSVLMP